MKKNSIPNDIKDNVIHSVEQFNANELTGLGCYYRARFRGRFLYLERHSQDQAGPICRLTFCGEMNNWEFAIFKWSSETYDPNDWFFPGSGLVNGTVEGAMKAGMEAYPL